MDSVVLGVSTLCTTHQELIIAKTELVYANAELGKKVAANDESLTLLGDKMRTVHSELQKTLPSKVRSVHLQVSL